MKVRARAVSVKPVPQPPMSARAGKGSTLSFYVIVPPAGSSPVDLDPAARRDHVRTALLAYELPIIQGHPDAASRKFDKMTTSPFVFFRGTADLFYRDLAGLDAAGPMVLAYADVHPENVGVLKGSDGDLYYGPDDFDETYPAPFTWDLRRGATAFELVGRERAFSDAERATIVCAYLDGYASALANDPVDAPGFVERVIDDADEKSRKKYLAKYVDLDAGEFLANDDLRPLHGDRSVFDRALEAYRHSLGRRAPSKASFYRVKAVAERHNSGTGSIGLRRYYVLIEGKSDGAKNDRILELKQWRPSVLTRHIKFPAARQRSVGMRVADAVLELWHEGDRFSGIARVAGADYKVRERQPSHERLKLEGLGARALARYAAFIGTLIAGVHTNNVLTSRKPARRLLRGVITPALTDEIARFGVEQADRTVADFESFREMHAAGDL